MPYRTFFGSTLAHTSHVDGAEAKLCVCAAICHQYCACTTAVLTDATATVRPLGTTTLSGQNQATHQLPYRICLPDSGRYSYVQRNGERHSQPSLSLLPFTGVALPMHRPGSTASAVGPKNTDVEGSVNGARNAWLDIYTRIRGGIKSKASNDTA